MNYTLNTEAAKQADNLFSKIECKGAYLGMLTRAEQVTSKKGSKGVDFSFKSETGSTADYLTIWTHNGDNKQLQGYNTLMAIMTCLRVKELKAEGGEVEKYDRDEQKRVKVTAPLFKALMNQPVGLLIHMEEYEKTAGGTAWKPAISGAYDKDGFTASEILTKAKSPETLTKMTAALRDRPLKGGSSKPTHSYESENPGAGMGDDFSEIPF